MREEVFVGHSLGSGQSLEFAGSPGRSANSPGGVENGDNPTKDTITLIFMVPGDNQFNVIFRIPSSMTLRGFLSKVNPRQKGRRSRQTGEPPFDSPPA